KLRKQIWESINLQEYCSGETCLASKAKLQVWMNIGVDLYYIQFLASNDSIPVKDNNHQCSYTIKSGLSYEIRQYAKNIEDLIEMSKYAINSIEIKKYEITFDNPIKL
ncbi:hypothetical protein RFI_39975, partial [Reticulomyxa filosa]